MLLLLLLAAVVGVNAIPYNYCQAAGVVPSQKTDGLTLVQVQIIHRHGDRTPTMLLPSEGSVQWDCAPDFLLDHSYNTDSRISPPKRMHRMVFLPDREELNGDCALGQLTSKGYDQHLNLGAQFRKLYVDQYGLVSENYTDGELWVRSSNVPRTFQSLMANLRGLYPPHTNVDGTVEVIDIHTMDNYREDLWANPILCPKLTPFEISLRNSSEFLAKLASMEPLGLKMQKIFKTSTPPSWDVLFDNLLARECHQLPFPEGLTLDMVRQIEEYINWRANYLWTNPEMAQLSMAPLLKELLRQTQLFVTGNGTNSQGKPLPRYLQYSAHDTTVGPLGALMGAFDGVWPPYASHMEIELWKNTTTSNYFVQVKYNGVVYNVNGCDVMCPYNTWIQQQTSLIPANYKQTCQI